MPKVRRLSREVAIVGAGMSKFGLFKEKTSRDLFGEAYLSMAETVERGFDPGEIEAVYVANFSGDRFEGQGHLAPILADAVGLIPRPATRIEDACASGGAAIRQGMMAIASGMYDVVLVGGAERMSGLSTMGTTDVLAAAGDMRSEMAPGFTFPGVFAAMATAYMQRYGMAPEDLLPVTLKDHANGALNPKAQFNRSLREMMLARMESARQKGLPVPQWASELDFLRDPSANPLVAWPLRLFDCTPITDGAACLLLVAAERAHEFSDDPLYIIGSGQASDTALPYHADLTFLRASQLAGQMAYAMAGVTPADIRLAEVHDCFTIAEILATEDLGFFAPGTGFRRAAEGVTCREGALPVNTSGGLKAKGHPVGASGVAQAVEIWEQMRGEAGARQVPGDVPLALAHNLGGTGGTAVVHIFERR